MDKPRLGYCAVAVINGSDSGLDNLRNGEVIIRFGATTNAGLFIQGGNK